MDVDDGDLNELRRLEPSDAALQRFVEVGGQMIPVGPFLALLEAGSNQPGYDFAMPRGSLGRRDDVLGYLEELRRVFHSHQRPALFEFNEPLFPTLAPMLEDAGFRLTEREPVMLCSPSTFRSWRNPQVDVRFLGPEDSEDDLSAYQRIFTEILLELPWDPTPERIDRLRREARRSEGRGHALGFLDGEAVGTGFVWSSEGVAEITRVATLPEARRRGVAATLTSVMVGDRFDRGDTLVWLTAQTDVARALYEKLGFRSVGDRLYFEDARHSGASS